VSANLDLVRSLFAAWEQGYDLDAEWAHPDMEFVIADGPDMGRWTGIDGLTEAMRHLLAGWEDARMWTEDYRELDTQRVVVFVRYSGRGKMSGLEVAHLKPKGTWLVQVHDGRVSKIVRYWDPDRALADLGLME
jgi:ketosteroid isomerase-like protein